MDATRCLREEHQVILRVLECFEIALQHANDHGEASRGDYESFLEFFRDYADRCHHCKEEGSLFPFLERNGVPREGGPMGVMLYEHEYGRAQISAMSEALPRLEAGDRSAVSQLVEKGRALSAMLRDHIDKEEHCFFGIADQVIQGEERSALLQSYREIETEPDYRETYERGKRLAEQLVERYGRDHG
jgi:hemerythrin-like domain-containing protein